MPAIIKAEVEDGALGSNTNNNGTSAFNHESVAIRSGVGLTTRIVCSEYGTVREDMKRQQGVNDHI